MPDALQQRCQHIMTSPVLTPGTKRHFLALEAENNRPIPPCQRRPAALDEGFICDMFEGHAPYKTRATCCRTTLNFWLTAQNGWSWKGERSG